MVHVAVDNVAGTICQALGGGSVVIAVAPRQPGHARGAVRLGLADSAHHVIGCHSSQERRVHNAWADVASTIRESLPHGLSANPPTGAGGHATIVVRRCTLTRQSRVDRAWLQRLNRKREATAFNFCFLFQLAPL